MKDQDRYRLFMPAYDALVAVDAFSVKREPLKTFTLALRTLSTIAATAIIALLGYEAWQIVDAKWGNG